MKPPAREAHANHRCRTGIDAFDFARGQQFARKENHPFALVGSARIEVPQDQFNMAPKRKRTVGFLMTTKLDATRAVAEPTAALPVASVAPIGIPILAAAALASRTS